MRAEVAIKREQRRRNQSRNRDLEVDQVIDHISAGDHEAEVTVEDPDHEVGLH